MDLFCGGRWLNICSTSKCSLFKAAARSALTDPEDIQGQSLWFRKSRRLTNNMQKDTYNIYLYLGACVCVLCVFCVTSVLSSWLFRFPRGLLDVKTIFVPEALRRHTLHKIIKSTHLFSTACCTAKKPPEIQTVRLFTAVFSGVSLVKWSFTPFIIQLCLFQVLFKLSVDVLWSAAHTWFKIHPLHRKMNSWNDLWCN